MASPGKPAVSVVIVCWNSAAYLPRCLEALGLQRFSDFETILVDNASTDGSTAGIVQAHPRIRLQLKVLPTNVGFAAASNIGARLAAGTWLALLNPDAFPEADWLSRLVNTAASHPNAFFASRQLRANSPALIDGEGDIYYTSGLALRANYNVRRFDPGQPREVFSACAAAAMYPRDAFLAAGGFDEDYFAYHEDVDIGFRLRLRGLRCCLVPDAVVHHVGASGTGARSAFSVYHGHRNLVWTYVKNMPAPWFWFFLPLHLAVNIASIVYFLFAGHGAAILRAKVDALRGLRGALAKRRLNQGQSRVAAAAVLRHMNWNPFGPLEGWPARQWPPVD